MRVASPCIAPHVEARADSGSAGALLVTIVNGGPGRVTDVALTSADGERLASSHSSLQVGESDVLVASDEDLTSAIASWVACGDLQSSVVAVPPDSRLSDPPGEWFGVPAVVAAAIGSALVAGLIARFLERQKAAAEWSRTFAENYGVLYFEFLSEIDGLSQVGALEGALARLTKRAPVPRSLSLAVDDGVACLRKGLDPYQRRGLPQIRLSINRVLLRPTAAFRRRSVKQLIGHWSSQFYVARR